MERANTYQNLLNTLNQQLNSNETVFNDLLEMKDTIQEMKKIDGLYDNGLELISRLEQSLINSLKNQVQNEQNMLKIIEMNLKVSHSLFDKIIKWYCMFATKEIKNRILTNFNKYQMVLKEISESR